MTPTRLTTLASRLCAVAALAFVLGGETFAAPKKPGVNSINSRLFGRQSQPPRPQTPVFRTNTDLVTVPVFVKGANAAVAGLRAEDFVLTDNGVRQQVESLDSESLPVDVTILMETGEAIENYRKTLNEQVRRIAAMMRPTDRIEVLGIDNYVSVLVPFGPPTRSLSVGAFRGGGMMSVNDALVAALLREPDPDRQHLVIAMTDSIDTMSTLNVATVRDVAKQSGATLVVSWITLSEDGDPCIGCPIPPWATASERLERHVRAPRTLFPQPMLGGIGTSVVAVNRTVPARQQWLPHYDPPRGRTFDAFALLREAAEFTGGAVHPPGVFKDRNAAAIFDKIYADFRRNYVLRYLPQGVSRDGWHDVHVTVPAQSGLEVRSRRGYFIEAAPAPPPPPPPPAARGSLAVLIEAAGRDDLAEIRAAVRDADTPAALGALISDFRAAGVIWPSMPRREFVVALALAESAVSSPADDESSAGISLLGRYATLVQPPTGADQFERDWLAASTSLLTAVIKPAESWVPVINTVTRLPDEPRLLLARAIVGDQFVSGLPGAAGGRVVTPQAVQQVVGYYDEALKHPEVAQEARIRKGWLLKRLGRESEARVAFDLAHAADDTDAVRAHWLQMVESEPVQPLPSMVGESWSEYWRGDRRVLTEAMAHLVDRLHEGSIR
jgi:hypothetical protein